MIYTLEVPHYLNQAPCQLDTMKSIWSGPYILIPNAEHCQHQNVDTTHESDPGVADMDREMHNDSQPEQRAVTSVVSLLESVVIAQLNCQTGAV